MLSKIMIRIATDRWKVNVRPYPIKIPPSPLFPLVKV